MRCLWLRRGSSTCGGTSTTTATNAPLTAQRILLCPGHPNHLRQVTGAAVGAPQRELVAAAALLLLRRARHDYRGGTLECSGRHEGPCALNGHVTRRRIIAQRSIDLILAQLQKERDKSAFDYVFVLDQRP